MRAWCPSDTPRYIDDGVQQLFVFAISSMFCCRYFALFLTTGAPVEALFLRVLAAIYADPYFIKVRAETLGAAVLITPFSQLHAESFFWAVANALHTRIALLKYVATTLALQTTEVVHVNPPIGIPSQCEK